MAQGRCGGEELHDLGGTENHGQLGRLSGKGKMEGRCGTAEGHVIEEPSAVDDGIAGAPGEMSLLDEMHQVALHVAIRKLVKPTIGKLGEARYRAEIGLLGLFR